MGSPKFTSLETGHAKTRHAQNKTCQNRPCSSCLVLSMASIPQNRCHRKQCLFRQVWKQGLFRCLVLRAQNKTCHQNNARSMSCFEENRECFVKTMLVCMSCPDVFSMFPNHQLQYTLPGMFPNHQFPVILPRAGQDTFGQA